MALKPPPRGKAQSLVANEKPPPVDIPTAKTKAKPPKPVPLPPILSGASSFIDTSPSTTPARKPPPRDLAPLKKNAPKPPPSVHMQYVTTRSKGHGDNRSRTPFVPGQKPDGIEGVFIDNNGNEVPTGHRPPIGARMKTVPYYLPWKGPAGDEGSQLNAEQLAEAERQRRENLGAAGVMFRDVATSLVPHTFVDIANGAGIHLKTVVKDAGNLVLNLAPPERLGVVAAAGLRGSKAAKAFYQAAHEGQPVGDAVKAALRESKSIPTAGHISKTVRPYMPDLEQSTARKAVHAQVDEQVPAKEAAKVKAALDHAAATHARAVERETGDAAAGHAATKDYYLSLHERTDPPVPGSPRTYVQAKGRLDALDRQINAFVDQVAEKVGHPSGMSEADLRAEQLKRNAINAKFDLQQAGRTRSGRLSGASGAKIQRREKLISQEQRDYAQQVIDEMVVKHPEIPEFQRYKELEQERDQLRAAVNAHEEQQLGALAGHPTDTPVDFGVHPGEPPAAAPTAVDPTAPPAETTVSPVTEPPPEDPVAAILADPSSYSAYGGAGARGELTAWARQQIEHAQRTGNLPASEPLPPEVVHAATTTAPDGLSNADTGAAASFDPGTWQGDIRDRQDVLDWQHQLRLDFGPLSPDRVNLETRDGYTPRTLHAGELEVQIPQPRSEISKAGIRLVDEASRMIDRMPNVENKPGVRLMTSTERAVKGAGRMQRQESSRRLAAVGRELKVISKIDEGSPEDVATFWFAQLPASHRNADGLSLIRDRQRQELEYITSGQAMNDINRRETAVRAQLKDAGQGEQWALLAQLHDFPTLRQDLPYRVEDITASLAQLSKLIVNTPAVNEKAIEAMRTLAADRAKILVDGGRLDETRAHMRQGLLARFLGIEPDGSEVYVGHRIPKPESFRGSTAPSGGVGRVQSPEGVGSANEMVLVRNGRLRASTRVAFEDWQSAQVFEQANIARDDLGKMGVPWTGGHVPEGHVLVNPKGATIPPHWKTDELAQFTDDQVNRDEIRTQAREVLQGFLADGRTPNEKRAAEQALIELAYQKGLKVGDLRVVPKRLVDRYYSQFRSFKGRSSVSSAYDLAIDAVATSIVFARVGYIPKNVVQNLIMALPHQGAMFVVNAPRAAQVLSDPPLRDLILGEVSGTGATGALGREAVHKRLTDKAIHYVTTVADDPVRVAAFLHEAAAEGVISKVNPLLTQKDRESLYALLQHKSQRARLNDIRSRAVEAMADFTRLTPDQAKTARRILIIPGWLVAGSRYPFHFAATHPVRSALIAYMAMGEPGAPNELQFNQPITNYLHGRGYLQGIDTRWGRERVSSIDPVSTPWQLGAAAAGSVTAKTGPFDFTTPTVWDESQPLIKAIYGVASGQGLKKSLLPLVPNYGLIHGILWPQASKHYPDDATVVGRLKREVGIIPVHVIDDAGGVGPISTRQHGGAPGLIGGASSSGGYPGEIK